MLVLLFFSTENIFKILRIGTQNEQKGKKEDDLSHYRQFESTKWRLRNNFLLLLYVNQKSIREEIMINT